VSHDSLVRRDPLKRGERDNLLQVTGCPRHGDDSRNDNGTPVQPQPRASGITQWGRLCPNDSWGETPVRQSSKLPLSDFPVVQSTRTRGVEDKWCAYMPGIESTTAEVEAAFNRLCSGVHSTSYGKYEYSMVRAIHRKERCPMTKQPSEIRRGDIFFADLNPVRGSEQGGLRPVLIIQNNIGNRHSPTVIIAPITSKIKKNTLPTHVGLPRDIGLPAKSMVLLEQVRTIDKSRLTNYVAALDDDLMDYVDGALGISLALDDPCREEEQDEMTLCLCPTCAAQFYNSPEHIIRRVDPFQDLKDYCTYCQVRKGYDYYIRRVEKKCRNRLYGGKESV